MLDSLIDIFRLKQYFNLMLGIRDVGYGIRDDAEFIDTIRRAVLPLPFEEPTPHDRHPFSRGNPRPTGTVEEDFALVATGGSGALASVTGAWKAFEDWNILPSAVSVCSGSSLFGFPLAAGVPADEVAHFTLSMRAEDYVDINWHAFRKLPLSAGRGFAGIVLGERLEKAYTRLLGNMTLKELKIPCYAPLWNIEENRIEYIGPDTYPDLPVARAIRAAISIPLFINPVRIGHGHWCDGGIVDIFPVRPILDLGRSLPRVLAINGFYPPDFAGEDATGWEAKHASIFHIASQVRSSQQIELARTNLRLLQEHSQVDLISPVPYSVVQGIGFYKQFIDKSDWPKFMRQGRKATHTVLARWALGAAARPRRRDTSRSTTRRPTTRPV